MKRFAILISVCSLLAGFSFASARNADSSDAATPILIAGSLRDQYEARREEAQIREQAMANAACLAQKKDLVEQTYKLQHEGLRVTQVEITSQFEPEACSPLTGGFVTLEDGRICKVYLGTYYNRSTSSTYLRSGIGDCR